LTAAGAAWGLTAALFMTGHGVSVSAVVGVIVAVFLTAVRYYQAMGGGDFDAADKVLAAWNAAERKIGTLSHIMTTVAGRTVEDVGHASAAPAIESVLGRYAADGAKNVVLFVDSPKAIKDWGRFRLVLQTFKNTGRTVTVVAPWKSGIKGALRGVVPTGNVIGLRRGRPEEASGEPVFADLGNGLCQVNVSDLKKVGRFKDILTQGNFRFLRTSTVGLELSAAEDNDDLKKVAKAAEILISILSVMHPDAINWGLINQVLTAIARAA
jgi:hypothetical protein